MNVRTPLAPSRAWRLRDWPGDASLGHLIFVDHTRVPTPAEVAAGLDRAREHGYRGVRTSALFPAAADVVAAMGFTVADRLALLRLDRLPERTLPRPAPRSDTATRPLRPWRRGRAAAVDRAAFGDAWGNDRAGLLEIARATPEHRSRWAGPGTDAFAISGAAGATGYLQRLAVHPAARRQGLATALVADALGWMHRRRLESALVNTGVGNVPALALYHGFGFTRLGDELTVAEYDFQHGSDR